MKKEFEKKYNSLVDEVRKYVPDNGQLELLSKAFWFGFEAHKTQFRRSGEPYFVHCAATAHTLAELHMDVTTIAAGLLHDVVEDTGITKQEVEENFGNDIAELVDGVTKITDLMFKTAEAEQAENFRKMLLSMAKDLRVVMIKLADRLHNMQTLEYLPAKKQIWIAQETIDVYSPLAFRFGIAHLAWQLEDLALKYIDPKSYAYIEEMVTVNLTDRLNIIDTMKNAIKRELDKLKINCDFKSRPKSYYSIYKKIKTKNIPFEEIYDVLAMRLIADKKEDCYAVVGVVHSLYTPVVDRFKDFIATPKRNGYQSIHTTVINPNGKMMELQIRTNTMDYAAEWGIAAQWSFKSKYIKREYDRQVSWVRQFMDWNKEDKDVSEFMESFKFDLVQDEIFVFTPKGTLINLPVNSTPVDFAFAVHSEIGLKCIGAKINSKVVPLNSPLQNGDEVEILTSSKQNPQEYWSTFVVTARARSTIRQWFSENRRLQFGKLGKELLTRELAKHGLELKNEDKSHIAHHSGYTTMKGLYQVLGRQEIAASEIVKRVYPALFKKKSPSLFERIPKILKKTVKNEPFIIIDGDNSLVIKLSNCCMPVHGDKIIGYYSENKGVTVHRNRCREIPADAKVNKQRVNVNWAVDNRNVFLASLRLVSLDRKHLLRDIAIEMSEMDINMKTFHVEVKDSAAICDITLEVINLDHLNTAIQRLENVQGIQRVKR